MHSCNQAFSAPTASIINGDAIKVEQQIPRIGTEIRLDGIKPVRGDSLADWVERELQRLCEAFPVEVWFNGVKVPRPLAASGLHWRDTTMGRVLVNLETSPTQWRYFLQGLPIGRIPLTSKPQIVLLPDDTLAKLPDRQCLLNEAEDHKRIQAAVDQAYREALIKAKALLAPSEFVSLYAETCLSSSNTDLLNDVPFVPKAWFRNWEGEPAGFLREWDSYKADGILSQDVLQERGVWQIEDNGEDEFSMQSYLEAKDAFLLEQWRLGEGHWLNRLIRSIIPEQVCVRAGEPLYLEPNPGLADYGLELKLVDTLFISLPDEPEYAVDVVRQGDTLYLTPNARGGTQFVSDYIFDDRYDEDREDEDGSTIATFIAVGCSQAPEHVVNALLPDTLRYTSQPKLANAVVRLIFNEAGKLQTVAPEPA